MGTWAQAQIAELFTAAFKDPFVRSNMIGFRFTVGGGKKVRQKYGDDMPKYCRCAPSPALSPRGRALQSASLRCALNCAQVR